jgi:nucleoid-associated protein EbfC
MPTTPEFDLNGLLQQAQRIRGQLAERQRELLATDCRGTAGGGLVTAVVSGRGALTGLEISPILADPERTGELAEMILTAVQDAHMNLRARFKGGLNPIVDALGTGTRQD